MINIYVFLINHLKVLPKEKVSLAIRSIKLITYDTFLYLKFLFFLFKTLIKIWILTNYTLVFKNAVYAYLSSSKSTLDVASYGACMFSTGTPQSMTSIPYKERI